MLRIHFTSEDMARIRFASEPRIAWELSGSVQLLQTSSGALVFDRWRRSIALGRHNRAAREAVNMLVDLFPEFKYFPDFLTPSTTGDSTEIFLDTLLCTGRKRRMAEYATLAQMRRLPAWWGRFAEGDREVERIVFRAVKIYDELFLRPFWPAVSDVLRRYRQGLGRNILGGGVEQALNSLGGSIRWRWPVLEADYPVDRDLHLAGRGLEIVPAYFCWRRPVTMADADLSPTLVVPVERPPELSAPMPPGPDNRHVTLPKLLGRTRATILGDVVGGATSAQLRARTAVSAPAVSQHLAVLRDSGLIVSRREGAHVVHEATELGLDLMGR